MSDSRPTVGFIGLGGMGSRMASRLLAAGYRLSVFNKRVERARALVEQGAKPAGSPRELAAEVDVVISMVTDDAAVQSIADGPDGVLAGIRPDATYIEMSTVSPAVHDALASATAQRQAKFLGAPVSGSTPQAEKGELVIFVGGDEATYQSCKPIFETLGRLSLHMGDAASAARMKLVTNALLGIGVQALAETIALGLGLGLNRDRLFDAMNELAVLSPAQKLKLPNARSRSYAPAFPLRLMSKDYRLIQQEAGRANVPLPLTTAAQQWAMLATAAGRGDEDFSVVIQQFIQASGVPD